MQIVIDIPEETYDYFKDGHTRNEKGWVEHSSTVIDALICNSIKLPEHHGRLIDADALRHVIGQFPLAWEYGQGVSDCWDALIAAPTIIEAE